MAAAERESRLVELAAALSPKWQARAALDEQLAALGPPSHLPPNALARMERFGERIRIGRRRLKRLAGKLKQRRAELSALKINELLWKQSPRILALAEHESWIAAAEQQLRDAEAALAKLEPQTTTPARSTSDGSPPGAAAATAKLPPGISHQTLAALRAPAADLRRKSRAAREAKQAIGQAQQQAADHHETVEKALADAGHSDLPAALEKAGNLTAQLRRRVQLDERLDRMTRHRADLEEQSHELLERQILPGWILASLGGVFMLGVLLLLAGLFLPTKIIGSFGWTLAVLGVLAFGTAAAAKWLLEKAAARQLDSCRKQLTLLETQTKQAQQERDTLDEQLPKGGGSLTSRLQAAEAELAKLEALMPLDAKRAAAGQDAQTADQRAASSRDELKAAHRRWQAALVAAGLPKTLAPSKSASSFVKARSMAMRNGNCAMPATSATAASASLRPSPPGSSRYSSTPNCCPTVHRRVSSFVICGDRSPSKRHWSDVETCCGAACAACACRRKSNAGCSICSSAGAGAPASGRRHRRGGICPPGRRA